MPSKAFETIIGVTQIASSAATKTITEGTDYTLPAGASATNCFVRLANTRHTGMGRQDGTSSDHPLEDFGVHIDHPGGNITNDIRFTRAGTPAYDCEVRYEILCYIGPSGGANEFIVRGTATVSGTGQTLTGTTLTNITDNADVVVFLTGQSQTNSASANWEEMLFSASLVANASNWDPTFTRGTSSTAGTATVSYAVVEWVGSNWSVDRFSTTSDPGTYWSPTNNSSNTIAHGLTIANIAKAAIIEAQYNVDDNTTNVLSSGDAFYLDSATNIRRWRRSSLTTHTLTAWVIQNSQDDASARNFKVQRGEYRDDSINVSDPRTISIDLDTGFTQEVGTVVDIVAPLDETSLVASSSSDGSGSWYPRGSFNYWIVDASTISYKMSNDDEERRSAFEIIEWPEDIDTDLNVVKKRHEIYTDPNNVEGTPWQ